MTARGNFTIHRKCRLPSRDVILSCLGFGCLCLWALMTPAGPLLLGQDVAPLNLREVSPYLAPQGYVCFHTYRPVAIDGKIDEAAWQDALWTEDFVDIEGHRRPQPRFRTRAKMLWDETFFYVSAELAEPHVWGTLTAHDSVIFQDNDFEVFIDPDGDNHEYYEFEINALNTGWDLLLPRPYKDGGRAVNGWEIPGLKTAVFIQGSLNDPRDVDRGWTVELAFPWKALQELAYRSAPPEDGDQWRVNFSRVEWQHELVDGKYRKVPNTKEDNWVWSSQGVINMHRPETWGIVQFSTGNPGAVEFTPDPAGPTRHLLHEVYYAQQEYRKQNQRWAKTMAELGLKGEDDDWKEMELQVLGDRFLVTKRFTLPDGSLETWHIREDSKVFKE